SARTLPGYTVWQSFTAGATGTLVYIDVGPFSQLPGFGELRVYEGDGTAGRVLQTLRGSVDGAARPGVTWNRRCVNAPVAGGRRYTFEFKPDRGTLPDPYSVVIDTKNSYSGGRLGLNDPTGSYPTENNAVFRTWVDTSAAGKKGAGR